MHATLFKTFIPNFPSDLDIIGIKSAKLNATCDKLGLFYPMRSNPRGALNSLHRLY